MIDLRPRSFLWVETCVGPSPQVVFDEPRVGCADLKILRAIKLPTDDARSLDQLIADYPAPELA